MDLKKSDYIVEGFIFHDGKMAEKAAKEREGIKYIRQNTDMEDAQMVLQIYDKIIDQRLFETHVGLGFLKELQEYLMTIPYINNDDIRPIDIDEIIHPDAKLPLDKAEAKRESSKREASNPKKNIASKKSRDAVKIHNYLKVSVIGNIILILTVVAMYIITLTSNNPTILDYENKLLNRYAAWDQELTEREQQIRLKERELNITP